jgi:hypothetical protein
MDWACPAIVTACTQGRLVTDVQVACHCVILIRMVCHFCILIHQRMFGFRLESCVCGSARGMHPDLADGGFPAVT